jgi:hypothetical protein
MQSFFYPVLLWLHVVALIVWGGTMLLSDLRRFRGLAVMEELRRPKWISFIVAAICGVALFLAKADQYAYNSNFWLKMGLLGLLGANAVVFGKSRAKLAGGMSLLLWFGAVWAARGPATVKDVMHSMVDPSADFLFQSVQSVADDTGVHEVAPQTDEQWQDVRSRLLVLIGVRDILSLPGIRAARPRDRSGSEVENEPAEVQVLLQANPQDFAHRAQKLRDAATVALRAVDAKDKDGLMRGLVAIDQACEVCHLRYWYPRDQRAQEAAKASGVLE